MRHRGRPLRVMPADGQLVHLLETEQRQLRVDFAVDVRPDGGLHVVANAREY